MKLIRLGNEQGQSRLNVCLALAILILIGYFLTGLFHPYQLPECKAGDMIRTGDEQPIHKEISFDNYQKLLSKRSLFGHPVKEKVVKQPPIKKEVVEGGEVLKKLTLIGIISVDGKAQALIRDNEKRKQYFCTGGETIRGFKVEKVLKDKVILKSGDKEFELTLPLTPPQSIGGQAPTLSPKGRK